MYHNGYSYRILLSKNNMFLSMVEVVVQKQVDLEDGVKKTPSDHSVQKMEKLSTEFFFDFMIHRLFEKKQGTRFVEDMYRICGAERQ